jgi:iron complex transport system ATP-binding protein
MAIVKKPNQSIEPMTAFLEVLDLHLQYGAKPVLNGINIQLQRGQLAAICGLNGSGKSSLFRSIAGLTKWSSGEIKVDGIGLSNLNVRQRSNSIAYISTDRPRIQGLDVSTVLEMAAYGRIGAEAMSTHILRCLALVQGLEMAERSLVQLSDGEMQKVMMARALAQNTPIIVADEPTSFLDYQAKRDMMQTLQKMAQEENKLVLFSSHDLELVKEFADLRFVLANGTLKKLTSDELI